MENNFFIVFNYVLHIYHTVSHYDNILFSFTLIPVALTFSTEIKML